MSLMGEGQYEVGSVYVGRPGGILAKINNDHREARRRLDGAALVSEKVKTLEANISSLMILLGNKAAEIKLLKTTLATANEQIEQLQAKAVRIALLSETQDGETEEVVRLRTSNGSIKLIVREVAKYYCVDPREIVSDRRGNKIAMPRKVAMYLAREMTDFSTPSIGAAMGGKDHSTIIYAHQRLKEMIDADPELLLEVNQIKTRILGQETA